MQQQQGAPRRPRLRGLIDPPQSLDGPAEKVQRRVDRTLGRLPNSARTRRFLRGRSWLGHPFHPAMTDLVTGAWTVAWVFDVLQVFRMRWLRPGADAAVALGLLSVPLTALSGAADWSHTTGKARRLGLLHAGLNTLSTLIYLVSLINRLKGRRGMGMAWGHLGFALVNLSAYLGGEMVYDEGVGVRRADDLSEELRQAG